MTGLLLATDLSPHADRALDRAAMLAATHGGTLHVLHVVAPDLLSGPGLDRAMQAAAVLLHDDIAEAGLPAELKLVELVRTGEPDDAIVQAAREAGSTMLVLSAPHSDLLVQIFRGSVLHRVVRAAPCPVLVVRRRARRAYRRIVVAVDLSIQSRRALELALRLLPAAAMAEAAFTLVHASAVTAPPAQQTEQRTRIEDMLAATLARLASEGRTAPGQVEVVVATGSPEQVVAEAAARQHAELVVAGTLGMGGVASLLLGSTAEALLAILPCDVLAVRSPD